MMSNLTKRSSGFGLLRWILAMPVVLILLVIVAVIFYEGRKAYWDYRVTAMCEKDGGVRIYETVEMSESEYSLYLNAFGHFVIPRERTTSDSNQIVSKDRSTYIHRNNPVVRRNELSVVRKKDEKLLGVRISYSRVGGGFPMGIGHPSSYRCPAKLENIFTAIVFEIKEEK